MEKYFIVTEKSDLYKEYFNYKDNAKLVRDHYKEFKKENDIEAKEYYATNGYLYIVPTQNDLERFDSFLKVPLKNGLRAFKANSKINKTWIKSLEEKGLKVLDKPFLPFCFRTLYGSTRTRLFNIDKTIYCSIEAEIDINECPEGFIEIKASEFYKIIEENSN